jgi:hypothetical protein
VRHSRPGRSRPAFCSAPRAVASIAGPFGHLKNDFQLNRGAERKACDAIHQTTWVLVFSEDILQQLRSPVSDFRLIADVRRSSHRHAEPDDLCNFVKRPQMLPGDSESIKRCQASCVARGFHIEPVADPPNEFRAAAFGRKHPGQKEQIARLHCLCVDTKRLRWRRSLTPSSFSRRSAPVRKSSRTTICRRAHRRRRAAPPQSPDGLQSSKRSHLRYLSHRISVPTAAAS